MTAVRLGNFFSFCYPQNLFSKHHAGHEGLFTLSYQLLNDKIEKNEMGGSYDKYMEKRNSYRFLVGKLEGDRQCLGPRC